MTSTTPSTDHVVAIIGFDDPEGVLKMQSTLKSFSRAPDTMIIENGRAQYPPDTEVIFPGRNTGYTGGANIVIREAFARGYRFVTIANTDLVITNDSFSALRLALDSVFSDVAVLGGAEQSPEGVTNTVGGVSWSQWTGSDRWVSQPNPQSLDMLFVQGAFVTFTDAILGVPGPFDEDLFMFFDEIELGIRLRSLGMRVQLVPGLTYRHDNQGSRYRPLRGYLIWRNRCLVSRRHGGNAAPAAHLIGLTRLVLGVVARVPHIKLEYTVASLRGWLDGVRGITNLDRAPGIKYLDD
jgi:GT2 family glycosyltransferase